MTEPTEDSKNAVRAAWEAARGEWHAEHPGERQVWPSDGSAPLIQKHLALAIDTEKVAIAKLVIDWYDNDGSANGAAQLAAAIKHRVPGLESRKPLVPRDQP